MTQRIQIADAEDHIEIAQYRATWQNGNEPDGETQVVVYADMQDGGGGYILTTDDGGNGGSMHEAGDTIYPTLDDARVAGMAYAAAHDEAE